MEQTYEVPQLIEYGSLSKLVRSIAKSSPVLDASGKYMPGASTELPDPAANADEAE